MTAERGRRTWWRYAREVLRPEEARARPSRGALVADLVLALLLTVLAVAASADLHDASTEGRQGPAAVSLRLRPDPPARPVSPDPPGPRAGSAQGPHPLLVVLTTLPLAVRRRYPLAVFWTVVLAALATHEAATWITVLACAVAAYGALAYSRHRPAAAGGLAAAAVLTGVVFQDVVPALPSWLGPVVVLAGAGALAVAVRFWQGRLRAGRDRIDALQRAQSEAMRAAVDEERARIAAELHDIVTHNVSVMVIQAGAARKVMDAEPAESKRALLAIEAGGGLLATENEAMRNGVTETGPPGPRGGLAPQPGLDQLDALVTRVRDAGIRVGVELSPPPGPLPAGVDLAAYRVVQEALTNTIKHAAGAAASVSIRHEGDRLEIEVTDTGGTRRGRSRTGGRGLIGLRERLAVYGGTLEAGHTPAGGYRILARVPWRAS
ncbi:two-component sensor histidine kinase [Nonomuraea sp. MG754425]|uniref:sensor histidine kinase n=1 Tax=Nonomuraea sp. MG754425 TaxID=2570319 RepID=UPI001F01879E|nr:histidine kinase [Nonomuraea sp. MG754425]MCF6472916.1 two-component sensor histidine kinase [Nonomuraea sp. MG754425]